MITNDIGDILTNHYAFDLNDKGFYDYQRQTDLIVTSVNNKQTCTKPFVYIH